MSSNNSYNISRRRFWQGAMKRWASTGLSVREFCKQDGIAVSSFYYWRNKLTRDENAQEVASADFLEVALPAVEFAGLEVELFCGSVIRINHSTQIDLLTELLIALREANPC